MLPPFAEANKSALSSERDLITNTGRLTFLSRRAYAKPRGELHVALI